MKNIKHNENLPDQMADIASGQIFDVPPGYFDNLSGRFFDSKGQLKNLDQRTSTIKVLRPWLIAASFAVLALAGWFMLPENSTRIENLEDETELNEYILLEIMEYDLETLSGQLSESELYSITDAGGGSYEEYIEENLDDFEEIIY